MASGSGSTKAMRVRRSLFKLGYRARGKGMVLSHYRAFMASRDWPCEKLRDGQNEQLQRLMRFVGEQSPYYSGLFSSLGLRATEVRTLTDLQKLPTLTKELIRQHREELVPEPGRCSRSMPGSTGGSTGAPLRYRMSLDDHARGTALLYRGWGNGGYCLGDRVAIIAGSSLIPSPRASLQKRLKGCVLNMHSYSSFGMDESRVRDYLRQLNRTKPRFIRGYASAIYFMAKTIRDTSFALSFRPSAVFTTAETLFDGQRAVIQDAFRSEVFDNYGLNDGGVSAYECSEHRGMHIDMERAILEVVDDHGNQVTGRPGRILATSLHNYAFPFVRYETGDIGTLVDTPCACGRHTPRLVSMLGRVTELLEINGKVISSPVLTVLFGRCDIEQYQIVQEADDTITCRIVKGPSYAERDEQFIRTSLISHVGKASIRFSYQESILPPDGQKHRFILNRARDVDKSMWSK